MKKSENNPCVQGRLWLEVIATNAMFGGGMPRPSKTSKN
jgi:hypothetical protein